jgi:hypothetical protein
LIAKVIFRDDENMIGVEFSPCPNSAGSFWNWNNCFSGGTHEMVLSGRFNLLKSKTGVPCSEIKMNTEHRLTIFE